MIYLKIYKQQKYFFGELMNDQMIICKNLIQTDKIESLSEWFDKCPPQKGIAHWKDGRSAKETAKLWLSAIPAEFQGSEITLQSISSLQTGYLKAGCRADT